MIKILLIGINGQVGWELNRTLRPLGEVVGIDYPEIDLANGKSIRDWTTRVQPQVIVNAAAYTNVENAESEPDLAMAINGTAPGILAEEAQSLNAVLIHYSTDYVYDGTKGEAYIETDQPHPLNVYGWSKLAGDHNIQQVGGFYLIFRTAWVYSMFPGSFVQKVLAWVRSQETIRIVSDQIGSPTWARMLAEVTAQVLAKAGEDPSPWVRERRGLYHLGGEGVVSRFDWARAILKYDSKREDQIVREILPAKTEDFHSPVERPLFSPLDCKLFLDTFNLHLPDWDIALRMMMN